MGKGAKATYYFDRRMADCTDGVRIGLRIRKVDAARRPALQQICKPPSPQVLSPPQSRVIPQHQQAPIPWRGGNS
jgi:hypothetical protein